MPRPKEMLAPNATALAVLWDDGHESFYPGAQLRKHCPCADCTGASAKAGSSLQLVAGGTDARHRIVGYHPVGNYALGIKWADGHETGIYTFDYLRGICACPECRSGEGAPAE